VADTVRTLSQLLALFPDNITKDIHPQQSRDLTASLFGWIATTDPGVNNDGNDSAGIGAYFSTRSRWTNTSADRLWECESGATGAAVWRLIWPQLDRAYIDAGDTATLASANAYTNTQIAGLPSPPAAAISMESGSAEKISAMPAAPSTLPTGTIFPVLDAGLNKQTTLAQILAAVVLALSAFFYTYGGTPGPTPGPGGALDNNYGARVIFTDPYEYGIGFQDVEAGGGTYV
jgi:hypothetical protein